VEIITVEPNELLTIDGPASVRVIEGRFYVLGVDYGPGNAFTVMRGRRVVAKSLERGKVEIIVGPEGNFEKVGKSSDEVIEIWERALSEVSLRNSVIVVLGAMDVGKTTITTILTNKGVKEGLKVGIIDGDPGQNDVGPPTTVSAAIANGFITHLTQLKALKSIFIETTSIEYVWNYALSSIVKLVDYLKTRHSVDFVIINTDGWISGPDAIKFKLGLVDQVGANYAIVIKRENEANELLSKLSEWGGKTIVLPSPPNARVRDRDDRKIRREMGYSKYIMPPRDLTINLRDKPIINLPLFRGLTYDRSMLNLIRRVLGPTMYIEQWGDVAVAIGNVKEFHMKTLSNVNIAVLPMNWERGLLVALEDRENYLLTLGVLKRIYYNTGKAVITVSRNFDRENEVSHIRLGMIRLNENLEEVEKVLYIGKLESMLQSQGIPIISK